ncbi:MAG: DUF302 domain-containing protein [Bacteroidales bacterium]
MNKNEMKAEMSSEKMIEMFTHEVKSDQPIEAVTEKVPAACEQNKFALLQTYVYHEILESKGFPIDRKVFVYEICQAKTAAKMLTEFPQFSLFMPCKLAIYEDGGKTVISTMNMGIMLNAVSSNPELYQETNTMFNTIKSLMDSIS